MIETKTLQFTEFGFHIQTYTYLYLDKKDKRYSIGDLRFNMDQCFLLILQNSEVDMVFVLYQIC